MQDLTTTRYMAPHPDDNVHTDAPGALLVDFDSVLGQDRKPFDKVKLATTVTATVTVRSIADMAAGHCRGIVDGDGGYAIFYLPRDYTDRLRHVLAEGATVRLRGTATLVGNIPVIGVFAARQVDVVPARRKLPDDWYTTAARAEHNTHCTPCRESAAARNASIAENGASMERTARRTLGIFTTPTGVTR